GAGSERHGRRSRGWVGRAGSLLGAQHGRQAAGASAVAGSPAPRARGRAGPTLLPLLRRQVQRTRGRCGQKSPAQPVFIFSALAADVFPEKGSSRGSKIVPVANTESA